MSAQRPSTRDPGARSEPTARKRTEEVEGPSNAVLIVEDDADLRDALAGLLEEGGFMTMAVSNGREAVDVMRLCRPGVVILDLTMPVMDGLEVLAFIDHEPTLDGLPVLVVTAGRNTSVPGGRPLFHKPLNTVSLLRAVQACLAVTGRRG